MLRLLSARPPEMLFVLTHTFASLTLEQWRILVVWQSLLEV